jgi:hypothetical protein
MTLIIEDISVEDVGGGELAQKFQGVVSESYVALNESLSDNFDESLFDWDGKNASDL